MHLPFYSNRLRIDADLHLPDDDRAAAPYPVIIPASGFQGLKVIHPERFARALTASGYAVLAFDYRGFGHSEGERGRLAPQDWVEDVRAAVDRAGDHPLLDPGRIALLGWGLGGGVVIAEAADDPHVGAVIACNAIADGYSATRPQHDDESWARLLERVSADRARRASIGRSELTSPWDVVRLDRDRHTDVYVGTELVNAPGFGTGVTLESADYLLRFRPVDVVHRIAPRPMLLVHGAENRLHRPDEAVRLYEAAGEPKRLEFLDGLGHTEWMFDDHPGFRRTVGMIEDFLQSAWAGGARSVVAFPP